jgi:hypothetical protein
MQKPISRLLHGVADYKYAALVTTAPETVGFSYAKTPTTLCRVLGGGALLYSLLTRYELGAVRILPFKAHLAIDVVANTFALSAPWLFGFSQNKLARNTFLAAALTGLTISALTQTEEMPENFS